MNAYLKRVQARTKKHIAERAELAAAARHRRALLVNDFVTLNLALKGTRPKVKFSRGWYTVEGVKEKLREKDILERRASMLVELHTLAVSELHGN